MDNIVNHNGYALSVALSGAEAAGKRDFVIELSCGDFVLKKLYKLVRAFYMARAPNAYFNNHFNAPITCSSKNSSTVSGETE